VLLILNIAFPPFIGFLREVLIFKSVIQSYIILFILVFGVLFSCYYNMYIFWCFNRVVGLIFKINFFMLDVFVFLILVLILNF
jgi:hypothetical protein